MKKISKFADGGMSTLGAMMPNPVGVTNVSGSSDGGAGSMGGGASGTAIDGLGQLNNGAATIGAAINAAKGALGDGGGKTLQAAKKGGSIKQYASGGTIRTTSKNTGCKGW